MQNQTVLVRPSERSDSRLFGGLLLLTLIFLLFEVGFVAHASHRYFGGVRLVASHIELPWRILPGVIGFLLAQLMLHFLFTCAVFGLAVGTRKALNLSASATTLFAIVLWVCALSSIILADHFFYPNSSFSVLIPAGFSLVIFCVIWSFVTAVPLVALLITLGWTARQMCSRGLKWAGAWVLLFVVCVVYLQHGTAVVDAATRDKPDIILIGVDSLRPDFLGFNGSDLNTPNIDAFMQQAVTFSESLTPLARTFPSWVSILNGQYPVVTGIRTNLMDVSGADFSQTLPAVLRDVGYRTVFVTDESRFSNIDQRYGFDNVVTPPQGVNDFLLGTLNNFPMSNLLVNTALGQWLFPYSYANRAVFPLYDPVTFIRRLKPLLSTSRKKPLFLAVHFCLPHYPYAWFDLPMRKITVRQYRSSIERVDLQFSRFMDQLKRYHLLDHALVILLSDHGEAVELSGDRITSPDLYTGVGAIPRFYPPSAEHEAVDMSGGHGTDVLGLSQYHTVLAFREYGLLRMKPRVVQGMVSLLDIRPTVLDFLNIHLSSAGVSLRDVIQNPMQAPPNNRSFFVESDFSPEAVRSVHPEERKVLFEGIHYFKIDPLSTHVVVRDDMLKLIISSKQFADYRGHWVLALYPKTGGGMTPVLVNLKTGEWTLDFSNTFAKQSPAKAMLAELTEFFHL